ncbi:MAG: DUF412 domain-containing protein [Alkalimonas sp.]|nr:DUF412 domain-containing protein [Alkalimonas sp.]
MKQSMYSTISAGMQYGKNWPLQPELNGLLPENRMIRITTWAQKILPAIAVLNGWMQWQLFGVAQLPLLMAMTLLLLSMPVQGWYWLGVRSVTKLPPNLVEWHQQLVEKLQQHGSKVATRSDDPTLRYRDLGLVLQQAYRQLDKAFIRSGF